MMALSSGSKGTKSQRAGMKAESYALKATLGDSSQRRQR